MTIEEKGTIEVYKSDKERIKLLASKLVNKLGDNVSQRSAVMYAVNKLLEEYESED